jgi:membrane protein required for colicin V production
MQATDAILIGLLLVSMTFGAVRGFVREATGLASWLVGIWVAWRFSGFLHPYLNGALETPAEKTWAARIIVLLLVLFAGHIVGAILAWATHTAAGLSGLDRVLGLVFGFVRGVVAIGFLVMVMHALSLEQEPWWKGAQLAPYADSVGEWLDGFSGHVRRHGRREPAEPAVGT